MSLTTDQQKVINSLITNTLINDCAEIHEELCDHFSTGINAQMQHGVSFTDSLNLVHEEFGGDQGLLTIEYNHQKETNKLGKALYKKFALGYFSSFRWLIPVLVGGVMISIKLTYSNFPIGGINIFAIYITNMYVLWYFRNWRLTAEPTSFFGERQSLKATSVHQLYLSIMLPMSPVFIYSIFSNDLPMNLFTQFGLSLVTSITYLAIDFSVSFIRYAKTNWLLPPVITRN